jgi:hypothetical protein
VPWGAILILVCALCGTTYAEGTSDPTDTDELTEADAVEVEEDSSDTDLIVVEFHVNGRTTDGLGAIAGAKVELLAADSDEIRVKRTDQGGRAEFDGIPHGAITVRVLAQGWDALLEDFEVSEEANSFEIELVALEPPEESDDSDPDDDT